ncbi:unnamed protein product [Peronospora effusa]|nr:unnamed protein product [Peronospora effusa]
MEYWKKQKKSAHDVFELLGLAEAKNDLFDHPLFHYWSKYVKELNTEKSSVFDNLMFDIGGRATQVLADKGLSVDEVFELLRLHTVEDGVLTNPVFNQWYSYFEMVNEKHGNKESVIDFLSSKKGTSSVNFINDELEKANFETKSRVDELFVDLRLVTSCRLENDLCATWLSDGKSLDDVFKILDLNRAGYKLLEDPSMKTFARFTQVVSMDRKELLLTREESFEENEIFRGTKFASGTGGLRTTPLEKALFRLWFTQKKHPEEVYKMYFGKDKLERILRDEGNLFEIPLFITFVKYSEGYSRTKRLATDDEAIETSEERPWVTDPTYMVKYVDREFDVSLLLQNQFAYKMDKLGEMIMSVKESSSNSVKASSSKPMKDFSSMSALFAVKRVEDGLFQFWNLELSLDKVFIFLGLNTEMTPAELFENPSFRWWIDYAEIFFEQATRTDKAETPLMEVFKPSTNLAWLKNARLEENTKEFADRVWTNLLKEHLQADTSPEVVKTELMIPPELTHDEKDVEEYKHLYDRRKNDAEEKKKGDAKAWETNTKLREAKRKKLEEEELKKMEQEMKTKREED